MWHDDDAAEAPCWSSLDEDDSGTMVWRLLVVVGYRGADRMAFHFRSGGMQKGHA